MTAASSEFELTPERRRFLEAGLAGLLLSFAGRRADAKGQGGSTGAASPAVHGGEAKNRAAEDARDVFQHDLPNLTMDGWQVSAAEVTTGPGPGSQPHRHPGFVLGYVLEGDLRFQLAGQPERIIHAGEMFYEAPGSVHRVGASASPTKPVRFLAMIFAPKGAELMAPA